MDALHIHGYAPREDSRIVEKAIWEQLSFDRGAALPDTLGEYLPGKRSEALAIAQLLLLWHLLEARAWAGGWPGSAVARPGPGYRSWHEPPTCPAARRAGPTRPRRPGADATGDHQ